MFEVKFPAVYERISAPRSEEEVMRELDRRCGYVVDAEVQNRIPEASGRKKGLRSDREALPPAQDQATCKHKSGTVHIGNDRERCRKCRLTRRVGKEWKVFSYKLVSRFDI